MIELTKLNGQLFLLHVPLIEQVEFLPDTTITLTNGKKLIVQEKKKEIFHLISSFYRRIGVVGIASGGREET